MESWFIIFLLPLAAWSGWWVGMRKEARDLRLSKSRAAYFEGLSFLLNDQTDRAIDVFLGMADVDQQTFDNQLTLGALFRKRGELDRALHIHHQLASLVNLDATKCAAVQFELAEDYLHAGMYRQAQQLFETLLEGCIRQREVIQALWQIYERTEQWQKAIDVSIRWQSAGYGERHTQIAHYHCELAELALNENNIGYALQEINDALQNDRWCSRAYWMRAKIAEKEGKYVSAIHNYQSIIERAKDFTPDILLALSACYKKIHREEEYLNFLDQIEAGQNSLRITLAVADILADQYPRNAQQLLSKRLEETQNPLLLSTFLRYQKDDNALLRLNSILGDSIVPATVYRCNVCGFRQQRLIWHCPSCRTWSSFHPIIELKLEQS